MISSSRGDGPRRRRSCTSPSWVTSSRFDQPGIDRIGELAAGARLLPLVAEEAAALDRLQLDLLLAVGVGAEHGEVLARAQVGLARITGSSPGVTVTTTSWAAASPGRRPASRARRPAPPPDLGPHVGADAGSVAGGRQAARRPGAVHAAADDPDRRSRPPPPAPAPRRAAAPPSAARSPTNTRSPPAPRRSRRPESSTSPRTTGSPLALLPGNEVTHLSRASPSPQRRHRPEVAVRRAVQVDLRRHRPLAPAVALERLPGALDRRLGVDRREDGLAGDHRDLCHAAIYTRFDRIFRRFAGSHIG